MPITVTCECGNIYELKDEFSGRNVKCPQCGKVTRAPVSPAAGADPAFARDKFLLRQKAMSIKQKYYVWDEAGKAILYVERPSYMFRSLLGLLLGFIAGLAVFLGLLALASLAGEDTTFGGILSVVAIIGFFVGLYACVLLVLPKRHVTFYRDDSKRERLLDVLQDRKFQFFVATYTIRDHRQLILARLRKKYLYNLFRKRWECLALNGSVLCVAKEDSIVLSLLRRVLGSFFGLLRINFIILNGSSDQVIGEFNRKMTILDRYVLDMSPDPGRRFDRRVMLALGVMLDTGERR